MEFSVKNVKHGYSRGGGSMEAAIYIDGVKAGVVWNEGNGGPNDYQPRSLQDTILKHAITLPEYEFYGEKHTHNDETFIGELVEMYEFRKELKATFKKSVVFLKNQTLGVFSVKLKGTNIQTIDEMIKRLSAKVNIEKFDIKQILNSMDFDEACKLYKQAHDESEAFKQVKQNLIKDSRIGESSPAFSF